MEWWVNPMFKHVYSVNDVIFIFHKYSWMNICYDLSVMLIIGRPWFLTPESVYLAFSCVCLDFGFLTPGFGLIVYSSLGLGLDLALADIFSLKILHVYMHMQCAWAAVNTFLIPLQVLIFELLFLLFGKVLAVNADVFAYYTLEP